MHFSSPAKCIPVAAFLQKHNRPEPVRKVRGPRHRKPTCKYILPKCNLKRPAKCIRLVASLQNHNRPEPARIKMHFRSLFPLLINAQGKNSTANMESKTKTKPNAFFNFFRQCRHAFSICASVESKTNARPDVVFRPRIMHSRSARSSMKIGLSVFRYSEQAELQL